MKFVRSGRAWLAAAVLLGLGGFVQSLVNAQPILSADEVVRRAVLRAQRTGTTAPQPAYGYSKVTITEELDSDGRIKDWKERSYEVTFRDGATRVKLVTVNGRRPDRAEAKEQVERELNVQQLTGQPKSAKGDDRENLLTSELVSRFTFTFQATETLNGRPAYRLAFQPRSPEPPVRHLIDRLLNRISGTLWFDAQEFEIARAEIRLGSEVNLLGGIIGSLKKLAFTINRTRVADGLWLNTSSTGDFEGRKLLDPKRIKTKSRSSNFHPLVLADS